MVDLTDKTQLIKYLKQNGLYTKKKLGQNFLIDENALDSIIKAADLNEYDTVIEVGSGLGTLTEALSEKTKKIVSIELDSKLAKLLEVGQPNAKVINDDVLNIDPNDIVEGPYKLVANIPYYITSKILRHFLESDHRPELIVLMTQKEVAERICAKAGQMSLLSVSVQAYGEPEIVKVVKSSSFFPAPDVDSAILKIKCSDWKAEGCSEEEFFKVVKAGFASRRKTLLNNLNAGSEFSKDEISSIIEELDLDLNVRAQELSVKEWGTLCQKLQSLRKS